MHIVMVTPELAPVAKVGGLADVVAGLSRDLIRKGHTVEVMLPMYHCMAYDGIDDLQRVYEELWVPHFGEWYTEEVYSGTVGGIPCHFLTGGDRFRREAIYGYDDDMFRFVHFNRAVMEYLTRTERRPDILHAHDWQTGLIPVLLYEVYQQFGFDGTRAVYTIHNIQHQGHCWYGDKLLGSIGLDCGAFFTFDRMRDNVKHDMINLMKGGIVFSNFVTTVSPTYCNEIRTPEGGMGLEATLDAHHEKLGGVLNGIDYAYWNPEQDDKIATNFTIETFDRKFGNKAALRERTGMPDEFRPIIACISRLVPQKGIDLIQHGIRHSLARGAQFALLGSSPDPAIHGSFMAMHDEFLDEPNVYIELGHNEELAHLIYAGAEMLLVPSLFEPCGLTQLIALRYGTVPLVRRTGGLADTVFDVDDSGRGVAAANGFAFNDPDLPGVESVINRACEMWFYRGAEFINLAKNGMRCDHSWSPSGQDYENIYSYLHGK
jgi:starch synthase